MKNVAVPISGNLIEEAKLYGKAQDRSITKQIEHWIKLGKCAEDNPDLTLSFIKVIKRRMEQLKEGKGTHINLIVKIPNMEINLSF